MSIIRNCCTRFLYRKITWPRIFLSNRAECVKRIVGKRLEFLAEQALRGGVFSMVLVLLVWLAVFSYVVFYYNYVPSANYVKPVHLQIKNCDGDKDCPFPAAHVRLTKKQQLLMMGQQYKIYVRLEMPESPVNKNLGMFMICMRMVDTNGFLASQSCRSNMMHYNSDFLHYAHLVLLSPLYLFGSKEEKQLLLFELYSDFEDDRNHPVTDVYLEVQAHNIEIYNAQLEIKAYLCGLRYFMYYWPVTSFLFGILFNAAVGLFITSLSFYHRMLIEKVPAEAVKLLSDKISTFKDEYMDSRSQMSTSSDSEMEENFAINVSKMEQTKMNHLD